MDLRILFLSISVLHGPVDSTAAAAARRFVPGVRWRAESAVHADFTCRGRRETAILGVSDTDIVIAVFLSGLAKHPEVLRYSLSRDTAAIRLTTENLNWDPRRELGLALPGFRRSRTCQGLNVADGEVDSAHIYWDHDAHRFEDWTL